MDRLRYSMAAEGTSGGSGGEDVKYYNVGNPKLFDIVLGAMHTHYEGVAPRFKREPVEVRDAWLANSITRLQTDRGVVRLRRRTLIGVGIDLLVPQDAEIDPRGMAERVLRGDFSEVKVPSGYELINQKVEGDRHHWFLFSQSEGF